MLCQTFKRLFRGDVYNGWPKHHMPLVTLEKAALKHCYICHALWRRFVRFARLASSLSNDVRGIAVAVSASEAIKFSLCTLSSKGFGLIRMSITIFPRTYVLQRHEPYTLIGSQISVVFFSTNQLKEYIGRPWVLRGLISAFKRPRFTAALHNTGNQTDSKTSFHCIQLWTENCGFCYKDCERARIVTQGNTRGFLIRLVEIGQPTPDQVRVKRIAIDDHVDKYMTLSHCWGSENIISLTTATKKIFEVGVDVSSLPWTFQDALVIARKIKCNYIWIDSLCIIQDSKVD